MALSSRKTRTAGPCSPHKTLIRFATLMGTFRMKEREGEGSKKSRNSIVPCNQALAQLVDLDGKDRVSFPSLALHGTPEKHEMLPSSDKDEVEAVAVSDLSRPIIVLCDTHERLSGHCRTVSTGDATENASEPVPISNSVKNGAKHLVTQRAGPDWPKAFETDDICKVPHLMLDNLSASFSLLLDARLRAYATFLSRHEASLAKCTRLTEKERQEAVLAIDQKLATLIEIGTHTSVDSIVTSFHPQLAVNSSGETTGDEENVSMPLTMEAVMDISIPDLAGGRDCITISVRVPGTIDGTFEQGSNHSRLKSVRVDVDTHELLVALIDRAGMIMSAAVEKANATAISLTLEGDASHREPTLATEEAVHDDMPPPQPRHQYHKRKELPGSPSIVSPDIGSLTIADSPDMSPKTPPPLQLDEDTESDLSAERCANIVDSVIGEIDTECFGPPMKRLHTN